MSAWEWARAAPVALMAVAVVTHAVVAHARTGGWKDWARAQRTVVEAAVGYEAAHALCMGRRR